MRTFASVLALGAVASLVACATAAGDATESGEDALTAGAVTAAVEKKLRVTNPRDEGSLWSVTDGNALSGNWLLQIPNAGTWGQASIPGPKKCSGGACEADFGLARCAGDADCGGGRCAELEATKKTDPEHAAKVCVGHDDAILDEIYGVMTRARTSLDVTSLTAPTGRFLSAMRNALTTLDQRNQPITARFLFGSYPGHEPKLAQILAELTRDMKRGSPVEVTIAAHRQSALTWNHSKIIAVDGQEAIIGGMNLWSDHYLDADPVRDVSVHVRGPAATAAQRFVNEIYEVSCRTGKVLSARGQACPRPFTPDPAGAGTESNVRMIPVGRTGKSFHNPADNALVAMMDAARRTIRISQQDIGSFKVAGGGVLPEAYVDAWIRAARRGVDVTVVVSNDDAFGGGGHTSEDAYFNGWSLGSLWDGTTRRMQEIWPNEQAAVCKHLHFMRLRSSGGETWASGMPEANHAKVVVVDDQAFYVGSQNLYDADLAEFGVIVDDKAATKAFVDEYYAPLLQHSLRTQLVADVCR